MRHSEPESNNFVKQNFNKTSACIRIPLDLDTKNIADFLLSLAGRKSQLLLLFSQLHCKNPGPSTKIRNLSLAYFPEKIKQ